MRGVVIEDIVPIHSRLGHLPRDGREPRPKGISVEQLLYYAVCLEHRQVYITHEVIAHRLETQVQDLGEENLEVQCLRCCLHLNVDFVCGFEFEDLDSASIFVCSFYTAVIGDIESVAIRLEFP